MRLSGTKILLTGANGGLGRAIAAKAQAEGAVLALCEKTQELADAAKAALPDNANAIALAGELTDEATATEMVATAIEQMGGLNGVVHNAAMLGDDDGMPPDPSLATWQANLDTKLTAALPV